MATGYDISLTRAIKKISKNNARITSLSTFATPLLDMVSK